MLAYDEVLIHAPPPTPSPAALTSIAQLRTSAELRTTVIAEAFAGGSGRIIKPPSAAADIAEWRAMIFADVFADSEMAWM